MKYLEQQPKLARLNELLETLWRLNPFYTEKWRRAGLEPALMGGLEQLKSYPFTERTELLADQRAHPPLGGTLLSPRTITNGSTPPPAQPEPRCSGPIPSLVGAGCSP